MKFKKLFGTFVLCFFLFNMFYVLILQSKYEIKLPTVQASGSISDPKTILWWHTDLPPAITIANFAKWCKLHSINTVAIWPYITIANRTYLQNYGIDVFKLFVTYGSSWNPPPPDNNYTDQMNDILSAASGYDGLIIDDTHNLWGYAHENETDDLANYQAFLDYVGSMLVPEFGADNVIVEMAIYGNSQNITKMPQLNATCTFSYYYPPDPVIRYYMDINYFNTSANAWNIKGWYDSYGLNTYYKYEGWLWFHLYNNSMLSTYSLRETFNAILTMSNTYNISNLEIWSFKEIYGNSRLSTEVGVLAKAFLLGTYVNEEYYYQSSIKGYWTDDFDSSLDTSVWDVTSNNANYTYAVANSNLTISFSGNTSGWAIINFSRLLITSEAATNFTVRITPDSYKSYKRVILRSNIPYYYSYQFLFGLGTSKPLSFRYINYTLEETSTSLGSWVSNVTYDILFAINETDAFCKISNSTWSWDSTITWEGPLKFNTLKLYTFMYQDKTSINGTYNSAALDWVINEPLREYFFPSESLLDAYFMLCVGLTGIVMLIAGPTWFARTFVKHGLDTDSIEHLGYAMLFMVLGFGFLVIWLWPG